MRTIDLSTQQQQLVAQAVDEVRVQQSTQAEAGGSGTVLLGEPSGPSDEQLREAHSYFDEWDPMVRSLSGGAPAAEPAESSAQIGPLHTGRIVFGGGVPVGGWSSLGLWPNGAFNFSGHFRVSGIPSYNVSMLWAIADRRGNVYTFTKRGRVAGTFEPGSRNFDWSDTGTHAALAAGYPTLMRHGYRWQWSARVNWDIGGMINSVLDAIKAAGFVVNTVKPIIG